MKGNDQVIQVLNEVLCAELTAVNQYFVHSMMCRNWGYRKLADYLRKESIGEMKHAQEVIERILYLEGVPNMQKYFKINVGQNVRQQMEFDVAVEYDAVKRLNDGIEVATKAADNGSRAILEGILRSEEEHIDWLEAQIHVIQEAGYENYLAQQLEG